MIKKSKGLKGDRWIPIHIVKSSRAIWPPHKSIHIHRKIIKVLVGDENKSHYFVHLEEERNPYRITCVLRWNEDWCNETRSVSYDSTELKSRKPQDIQTLEELLKLESEDYHRANVAAMICETIPENSSVIVWSKGQMVLLLDRLGVQVPEKKEQLSRIKQQLVSLSAYFIGRHIDTRTKPNSNDCYCGDVMHTFFPDLPGYNSDTHDCERITYATAEIMKEVAIAYHYTEEFYAKAQVYYQKAQDLEKEAATLEADCNDAALIAGKKQESERCYNQAYKLFQMVGDDDSEADEKAALFGMAKHHIGTQRKLAENELRQVLEYRRRTTDDTNTTKYALEEVLDALASFYTQNGDIVNAEAMWRELAQLRKQILENNDFNK